MPMKYDSLFILKASGRSRPNAASLQAAQEFLTESRFHRETGPAAVMELAIFLEKFAEYVEVE